MLKQSSRFFCLTVFLIFSLLLVTLFYGAPVKAQHSSADVSSSDITSTPGSEDALTAAPPSLTETPSPALSLTPTEPPTPEILSTQAEPADTATSAAIPEDPLCVQSAFIQDEVVVGFSTSSKETAVRGIQKFNDTSVKTNIDSLQAALIIVPAGSVCSAVKAFQTLPGVRFAEPNYLAAAADVVPIDPGWPAQYNLTAIHAPQGWQLSTGSPAVTIAILDTGVDLAHPDISGKLVDGYDFVNNDTVPQDDNGHGTHAAGIAAASSNNGLGIAGVSWGAQVMPVKVLDASGNGSYSNVASGIIWATNHGARVINLSLGGPLPSIILSEAVQYAASRGVILVGAAGNTGSSYVLYPAAYPEVVAVAASDQNNQRASFSNYGPEMDLTAPGVSIYSLYPGGGLGYRSGTSMAAPHVAGLAAILAGMPGSPTEMQVIAAMENTALDLGPTGLDASFGWGLIQMDRAIQSFPLTPTPTFTPTHTATPIPTPMLIGTATPVLPGAPNPEAPGEPRQAGSAGSTSGGQARPIFTSTLTLSGENFTPTASVTATAASFAAQGLPVETTPSRTAQLGQTVVIPAEGALGRGYFMPCLGSLCILLGITLFFYPFFYGKERNNHSSYDKNP